MDTWNERLRAALAETDMKQAELARQIGEQPGLIRSYTSGRVLNPRGDILRRIADALGVEYLWLREGVAPRRAGDAALTRATAIGDELIHRRGVAERIAGARKRRGITTPEMAALGTIIPGARWRAFETGAEAPTLLELQIISERLHESLDHIVSGHFTPVDSSNAVETERVRRHLNEPAPRVPTQRS